jgi:two-component system OmpR family response regulator/two-component system response regulator RstA
MNQRLLLIEDDQRLADLVSSYLRKNGYDIQHHAHGDGAAERIIEIMPDLVILDVMLPGKDGFEVCRAVRHRYPGRILMMTARDEEIDEILGLELGADDYLAKPVEPRRLLARIRALLRRSDNGGDDNGDQDKLGFGRFSICQSTREAVLNAQSLELTTAEFDLLWLASHAGEILSRDDSRPAARHRFRRLDRSIDARIAPAQSWTTTRGTGHQDRARQGLPVLAERLGVRAPLSMARMFARYFAQTMLLQFVLLLGFVLLLIVLSANSERERLQKQMDGTVRLIQRELLRQPPARRDASLRELQPLFAYPLALVRLPPATLDEEARARLASGQSWLDSSQQNLYAAARHPASCW